MFDTQLSQHTPDPTTAPLTLTPEPGGPSAPARKPRGAASVGMGSDPGRNQEPRTNVLQLLVYI